MNINEIYKRFMQNRSLKLHHLRTAAVGGFICAHFHEKIDLDTIVNILLVHDLGNVVRIKFLLFPHDLDNMDITQDMWEKGRQNLIKKYGTDDHQATVKMLKEICFPKNLIKYIPDMAWSNVKDITYGNDMILKILIYSDMRVGPSGVMSIQDRINEVKQRRKSILTKYKERFKYSLQIEKQIFEKCNLKPKNINDDSIKPIMKQLENYDLITS